MAHAKHTPGPWHVKDPNGWYIDQDPSRRSISYRPISVESVSTGRICYVGDGSPFLPNAHLIAAAPKLLAALQGLVDHAYRNNPEGLPYPLRDAVEVATDAIAEAVGEPS